MSLNGPLCRGSNSRLVITAVDWGRCAPTTLDEIYEVVVWSFAVLGSGVWPSHDHRGQPLTPGLRKSLAGKPLMGDRIGVWTETRGDWKWLKESFKFDHYANNRCCHLCGASRVDTDMLYTQTGPDAGWQNTKVTHEQYVETFAGNLPALAKIPGFYLTRVFIDSMHCVCMGVVPYVIGSVVWELQATAIEDIATCERIASWVWLAGWQICCQKILINREHIVNPAQGSSQKKRLEAAYTMYRTFCKDNGITVVCLICFCLHEGVVGGNLLVQLFWCPH